MSLQIDRIELSQVDTVSKGEDRDKVREEDKNKLLINSN